MQPESAKADAGPLTASQLGPAARRCANKSQARRQLTSSVINSVYQAKAVTLSRVSYQVDLRVRGANAAKVKTLVDQPVSANQLTQAERMLFALQLTKEDYPMAQYLLELLIQGLQQYKPSLPLVNKEIEEMLQAQHENDDNITVDQNGLARVIAKQQLESETCQKRLAELRESVRQIGLQLVKAQAALGKVDGEVRQLTAELRRKGGPE